MFFFNGILINNTYYTTLHLACISGNIDAVKYIISLNDAIVTTKTIFSFNFSISFSQLNFESVFIFKIC